jgi:hypothetical protein
LISSVKILERPFSPNFITTEAWGVTAVRFPRALFGRIPAADITSRKVPASKGLVRTNRAPPPCARAFMAGVDSDVMKPTGVRSPLVRNAANMSIPVMIGMFQSESTRSGLTESTFASASCPFSHSVTTSGW